MQNRLRVNASDFCSVPSIKSNTVYCGLLSHASVTAFCIFLWYEPVADGPFGVEPLKWMQKCPFNPLPLTELPPCGIPLIAAANVRLSIVTHTGLGAHAQTPLRDLSLASVSAAEAVSTSTCLGPPAPIVRIL